MIKTGVAHPMQRQLVLLSVRSTAYNSGSTYLPATIKTT